MTTQTQSTINLQTLTTFITSHLPVDTAINVALDKLESYGFIVFRFSHPIHGFRNIKFIPDSSYWYVKVTPVYSNHYMDEESETIDLYNVWEWLAWRIPSIFPQVEVQTDIMQLVREFDYEPEFATSSINEVPDANTRLEYIKEWEIECGKVKKTPEEIAADELDLKEWDDYFKKSADDLAWEEACKTDDEAWQNGQAKLIEQVTEARNRVGSTIQRSEKKSQPLTVTNRSLRQQTLDASAKILQHSLGNMMFRAEGLHPISDTTIHIQLDGGNDELDINFWPLLDAFRNCNPNAIDGDLCEALKRHGKIDSNRISSLELIDGVFHFTL